MNIWVMRIFAYLLSLTMIMVIYIYILNIPAYISQAPDLVHEYYYKHAISSFITEICFIALYISAAMLVGKWLNINQHDNAQQLITVALTTAVMSSLFMIFFVYFGEPKAFFTRWFTRVGYKAVLYDVILISSVYIMMQSLFFSIYYYNI